MRFKKSGDLIYTRTDEDEYNAATYLIIGMYDGEYEVRVSDAYGSPPIRDAWDYGIAVNHRAMRDGTIDPDGDPLGFRDVPEAKRWIRRWVAQ